MERQVSPLDYGASICELAGDAAESHSLYSSESLEGLKRISDNVRCANLCSQPESLFRLFDPVGCVFNAIDGCHGLISSRRSRSPTLRQPSVALL
jgi:hypothetical protein